MLKNIDPLLKPELLKLLCETGHGDAGVQADPGCDDSQGEAVERLSFYERAARAYAIVQTGEMQAWANLVFKKGVVADRLIA